MLKMTGLSDSPSKAFKANSNKIVKVGSRGNETVKNSIKPKRLKNDKSEILTRFLDIKAIRESLCF